MLAYNYYMAEASSVASSLWDTYFSFLCGAVRCVVLCSEFEMALLVLDC
jgi:hypothetical protein